MIRANGLTITVGATGRLVPPFASDVEFGRCSRSPAPWRYTAVAERTRCEVRARSQDCAHLTGSASAL